MSKYADLFERIMGDNDEAAIFETLEWLDEHPNQAPGRTITRTECRDTLDHAVKISGHGNDWERGFYTGLTVGGARVVPDPEPTNAELLEQLHDQYRMFPAQHLPGNGSLADYLDHKGVKAMGADDEHS